jgi:hypothetical protein
MLYLNETERRGKRARQRESVCVREGGWQQEEIASVIKMTVEENGPFGIRIGLG